MRRVVLVSCVSKKQKSPARAQDLYTSPLFKYNLTYARLQHPDAIYILSAKYGLLTLDEVVAPYNETLNMKGTATIKKWSERVLMQLQQATDIEHDEFIILAGERYRRYLLPHLARAFVPMKGLGLGRQLQFLKRAIS
jgi:hypothetical protein